jgi:hypothetical protein
MGKKQIRVNRDGAKNIAKLTRLIPNDARYWEAA